MGEKLNLFERAIGAVSPRWANTRAYYRASNQLMAASYRGAVPTRSATPWRQSESLTGMPKMPLADHRAMRDRARAQERDNPIAKAIFNRLNENVIGSGFKLQILSDDPSWNDKATQFMKEWFPSADFTGLTWLDHQRLSFGSYVRDGDVGGNLLSSGQVQLVESDYVSTPPDKFKFNVSDGCDYDQYQRVIGYYVMTISPDGARNWQRVPAKNMVFLKNISRVGQVRGEPATAQVFDEIDHLPANVEAAMLAKRLAACFGLLITTANPTSGIAGLKTTANSRGQQQPELNIEPGMIQRLRPGEDIKQIQPAQPGHTFSEDLRMLCRVIGAATGIPLELLLLDFSQTNFAGARAALLQAQRRFEYLQAAYRESYLSRIYRWRISKAMKEGALPYRADAWNHRWIGEPWPYLDPISEIQAQQLEIDAGFGTQTEALLSRGKNPEDHFRMRAAELQLQRDLKIPIYRSSYVGEVGVQGGPDASSGGPAQSQINSDGGNRVAKPEQQQSAQQQSALVEA